jgi:hypothetical protein
MLFGERQGSVFDFLFDLVELCIGENNQKPFKVLRPQEPEATLKWVIPRVPDGPLMTT